METRNLQISKIAESNKNKEQEVIDNIKQNYE